MLQFLFAGPKEVATHVREKTLIMTDEVFSTPDLYMDAHKISLWSDTEPKKTVKQAVSEEKQIVQPAKENFEKPAKIGQRESQCERLWQ